jgi:hypothetical protein
MRFLLFIVGNTKWMRLRSNKISYLQNELLADFFDVPVDYLLNGPSAKEMYVRILIKESLDEMEAIDLSKDAPYLENVTLTPNKSSVLVVFDEDKTIDDAIEVIRAKKEKIGKARVDLFGMNDSAA